MSPGILERLRRAAAAVRADGGVPPDPAAVTPAPAPSPPPPAPVKPAPARPAPWVAVCVCGLDGETLAQVVDTTSSEAGAVGRRVVYVTDLEHFEVFRERKVAVEQVVDVEARRRQAPELAWDLYLLRQFRMLGRKWRPVAVVSFGKAPSAECLAAMRSWAD